MILEHNRAPRNRRGLPEATHRARGFNPLCGDDITVALILAGDRVEVACFEGKGCAICTAAASCLTEAVVGLEPKVVRQLTDTFEAVVRGDKDAESLADDGALKAFGPVSGFPSRTKCAILPWRALTHALDGIDDVATSEG